MQQLVHVHASSPPAKPKHLHPRLPTKPARKAMAAHKLCRPTCSKHGGRPLKSGSSALGNPSALTLTGHPHTYLQSLKLPMHAAVPIAQPWRGPRAQPAPTLKGRRTCACKQQGPGGACLPHERALHHFSALFTRRCTVLLTGLCRLRQHALSTQPTPQLTVITSTTATSGKQPSACLTHRCATCPPSPPTSCSLTPHITRS